jgi:hypothetical protein
MNVLGLIIIHMRKSELDSSLIPHINQLQKHSCYRINSKVFLGLMQIRKMVCFGQNHYKDSLESWGYSSVGECLPSMHKALGLILNITN